MSVCWNKDCENYNDSFYPDENRCELFQDVTECEDFVDVMPIHDKCGLPVELCTCPDALVKFINGRFVEQ